MHPAGPAAAASTAAPLGVAALSPGDAQAVRCAIMTETLQRFQSAERGVFLQQATANLKAWRRARHARNAVARTDSDANTLVLRVVAGDWGEVTARVTREFGFPFTVLNMANAKTPGGGYLHGAAAQEENMFRRTDCHFRVVGNGVANAATGRYLPYMTDLLNARSGAVFLDDRHPRVCIRGPEDCSKRDLGYEWLRADELFLFFEMRAAADDNRHGQAFDEASMRRKIAAQLDTAISRQKRHLVLSAFGCGAFRNPAAEVARVYADEIGRRRDDFDVVVFAIFHAGYGPDNLAAFQAALAPLQAQAEAVRRSAAHSARAVAAASEAGGGGRGGFGAPPPVPFSGHTAAATTTGAGGVPYARTCGVGAATTCGGAGAGAVPGVAVPAPARLGNSGGGGGGGSGGGVDHGRGSEKPMCRYAGRCFLKNLAHWQSFHHGAQHEPAPRPHPQHHRQSAGGRGTGGGGRQALGGSRRGRAGGRGRSTQATLERPGDRHFLHYH